MKLVKNLLGIVVKAYDEAGDACKTWADDVDLSHVWESDIWKAFETATRAWEASEEWKAKESAVAAFWAASETLEASDVWKAYEEAKDAAKPSTTNN